MTVPVLKYRWTWELAPSPEALWPLVANTDRFNRDVGLPAVGPARREVPRTSPLSRALRARLPVGGIEWEEHPFEWVRPERFAVTRRFAGGPLAFMTVDVRLRASLAHGTLLSYAVDIQPRSWLGRVVAQAQVGVLMRRRFGDVFRRYAQTANATAGQSEPRQEALLSWRARAHLEEAGRKLRALRLDPGLVNLLVDVVAGSDEELLSPLRPYVLAARWAACRRDVLELCLHATRTGLVVLEWQLLCPHCRGAQEARPALAEIPARARCEPCAIDFSARLDQSVELVFRPHPAIRNVARRYYCVGGPELTPHVVLQQILRPGEHRAERAVLLPGTYRLRVRGDQDGRLVQVSENARTRTVIDVAGAPWEAVDLTLGTVAELALTNSGTREELLVLERAAWSDGVTPAADVFALQTFRDLFSREALRENQRVEVGTQTLLFTDLCDSTRLYCRVGDAPAFGFVMRHFQILHDVIARNDGAIVKTMGDAVMAVFRHPLGALRTFVEADRLLARGDADAPPLGLKAGIHEGPCIAVTLNERLDYFGSTVNIAARLQGLAQSGEVALSEDVFANAEIGGLLRDLAGTHDIESGEAELKGFEGQARRIWRVRRRQQAAIAL
ncbi:MAG: adenylate/guanylate cyclase domain-containing protein [Candidatus Schekmanbacteria bacterium]|nr:adenylate/guanylate cyclase domain-containing protein [Candidatus Schekmanbacteria bacterium]